jgi:hypothetical protein
MSGADATVEKDERGEDDGDEASCSSLRRFVGGSREEDAGAEKEERERDGEDVSNE